MLRLTPAQFSQVAACFRDYRIAEVVLANKTERMAWVIMARGERDVLPLDAPVFG
jgi:hypothetical protein